jgi:predicted secreted protein
MTSAVASYGLTLQWNGQPLAEVRNVSGPGMSFDSIDVTHYTSANQMKEYIAGFGDGGDVGIEANFIAGDTAGQVAFITDAFAKTARQVIITHTAGISWTFTAVVSKLDFTSPMDAQLGFTATLKVSGYPTLGITASADITTIAYVDSAGAKTSLPVWTDHIYAYSLTIDTASTWVKLTVTDATAATIVASCLGVTHNLTTAVQSGQITVGAAGTTTPLTVTATDTGKVPKTYTIQVVRP